MMFAQNDSIVYVLISQAISTNEYNLLMKQNIIINQTFVDVLLINNANNTYTTAYGKPINSSVYLNWNSHASTTWKRRTLRTVLNCAYTICSSERYLREKIKYIDSTFEKVNNYHKYVINQTEP